MLQILTIRKNDKIGIEASRRGSNRYFSAISLAKKLFWGWCLFLLIFNVIPLGNETNQSLSGNGILSFRYDYLLHAIMILCFSWIWVLWNVLKISSFGILTFSIIVISSAIGLELLQWLVPWRSFNPLDMFYNLVGAKLALVFCLVSHCCVGSSQKKK